jgi:hypothetical protein
MVQVYENCVLELKVNEDKDFDNLLVAFEKVTNPKKVSKPVAGIFNKKSVPLFKKILGSQVKKGLHLKVGDSIAIDEILKEGDKITLKINEAKDALEAEKSPKKKEKEPKTS